MKKTIGFLLLVAVAIGVRAWIRAYRAQYVAGWARGELMRNALPQQVGQYRLVQSWNQYIQDGRDATGFYHVAGMPGGIDLALGLGARAQHLWYESLLLGHGKPRQDGIELLPTSSGAVAFEVSQVGFDNGRVDSLAETKCIAGRCDIRPSHLFWLRLLHPLTAPVSLVVYQSVSAGSMPSASTHEVTQFVAQLNPGALTNR